MNFLAASSTSRSLVSRPSEDFVKKLPLEYRMVTKTYLKPTYLCDSSDSCDSFNSSDSSESSDSSDQKTVFTNKQTKNCTKKLFFLKTTFFLSNFVQQKTLNVMKLKNTKFDNSKTQYITKAMTKNTKI